MLPNTSVKNDNKRISISTSNCRHLDVNDYDRIIHGYPPILRKSKPLERNYKDSISFTLPSISRRTSRIDSLRKTSTINKDIEIVDIVSLVEHRVKHLRQNAFLYLMYAYPLSSELFSPYSFVEVPYSKVDKTHFFTISKEGFTLWSSAENHFTRIGDWYRDYLNYCNVAKIKLFKRFRLWKSFTVWHKAIKWKKFHDCRNFIEENLFFANPILHQTLLELQTKNCELIKEKFTHIDIVENWHLFYFIESQMAQFELTRNLLYKFREEFEKKLFDACYQAMIQKGFTPEDEILNCKSIKKLKDQISFTERASKKNFCSRLTNYLYLADLITINLLSTILCDSFEDLTKIFQIHTKYGPCFERLKASNEFEMRLEEPRPIYAPQDPFLVAELVLKPDKVETDPSRDVTLYVIGQMIDLFWEAIHNVKPFQSDEKFKLFTEPSIVGHQEECLYKNPASIDFMLTINSHLNRNKKSIITIINLAYDKVEIYIKRFEAIRKAYKEDLEMDREQLRKEKDLDLLIGYCERFTTEMYSLDGLLPEINLGLLKLKQGSFRDKILPTCRELLSILEEHLPSLAKDTVTEVREKAENLMTKLTTTPQEAQSFVNYLDFLEKCESKIAEIEKVLSYALRAFQIMENFEITVDEDEKENFLDVEEFLQQLKVELESKIESREFIIEQLAASLQKDIAKIFNEIESVRIEVMKPELIDENANSIQVRENLAELMEKLHECQENSQKIRGWQKQFRIDVTRFDSLDVVFQEVRLRQMLWDSLQQWKDCYDELIEIPFHKLNIQQVVELNTKILKNCGMLEKNLPKNEIVPRLKGNCEEFKEKIPILLCLRSSDLKPRHWLKIEQTLDRKLLGNENITMYTFEDANAFDGGDNSTAIQEISGQAIGEAKLEESLKKVDTVWKTLELSVISYRDARDIYILGGIDELQAILDDSNVTIATIAASKHIGTLKPRIDEWIRQLDLFGKTFEEWVKVQQSWIYLEAIFSAPDIQRQLPQEAKIFVIVDKNWKEIMRQVAKYSLALPAMTQNGYYESLQRNRILLEQITRCLEAYLEVKRVAFPRFYFLSNDELLEILAQTKNPHAVQPHLRKCFDAISRIEFGMKEGDKKGEKVQTNDILSMISPEGERVTFAKGLKARGSVEDWLSKMEEAMFSAVKRCMKSAYVRYKIMDKVQWIFENANQVVLTVSQEAWAQNVHDILDSNDDTEDKSKRLVDFEDKLIKDLGVLASLARTKLQPLIRKILCALITVDVHAKDSISSLIQNNVTKSDDFNWLKMLRYYWKPESELMQVRMASANVPYLYEYLGAGGVLVITPLTDRCYLCLMGAIQMELGGAPAGPAGTGKTETTKDLAKAIAVQCVVFNCSDGLDYKMMGRFFSGLAQSGSWCCFDEFNRIDIEVLSVIAQQLITIRNAKAMKLKRFIFEGREIKLVQSCAAFITMNPGYAGRTELPDNLKALFRPVSMMIPDYKLIAEVILYSEGFEGSQILAQKMVQTYKLCSEQLSQQSHYDFGMRAVKSVLVMAGALKRASPNRREEITLICALRDSNLPKFLKDDAALFNGIISDLFPNIDLPVLEYGDLQKAIEDSMIARNLQPLPTLITKCVQLYETMNVRWGVMLVGLAASGKTSTLHTLADSLIKLYNDGVKNPNYRNVKIQTINPKSITIDELYGSVNSMTLEWNDGLLGMAVRSAVSVTQEEHQWIVCDGPVDAVWIENLNTLLDDNKMLCLANSERIKLTPWVHMVFEVENLEQASPATVSRCGMVYVDSQHLTWQALVKSWLNTIDEEQFDTDLKTYIEELFNKYFDDILTFTRRKCAVIQIQVESSKIDMLCTILKSLLMKIPNMNLMEDSDIKAYICKLWLFATLWSIGSNLFEASRIILEAHVRKLLEGHENIDLPETSLWEYRINPESKVWEKWEKIIPKFQFNPNVQFFDMIVPTSDTVRFGYISEILIKASHPVLFIGEAGVGKSVIAKELLSRLSAEGQIVPVCMNFSAQTNSTRTQEMIENRLEKRKKTLLGAPFGKQILIFIDDVNMPKLEVFGSSPPIELLRQFLDFKGLYDREKLYWKNIVDLILTAACAPAGGARNPLSQRFLRHFSVLSFPTPNRNTLIGIFGGIIVGFFAEFTKTIWSLAEPLVVAAVTLYERIAQELLPTPTKSHYLFNLRDLSKCIQGVLQADSSSYTNQSQVLRLFYHEALRTFHDRLVSDDDKKYFKNLLNEISVEHFKCNIIENDEVLMFGDFMVFGQARENRVYEEIKNVDKLKSILLNYIQDYNAMTGKDLNLILFHDAIEHILRLSRLLRAERGNGLLVGLSGLGKQSITRLASNINSYQCMQIELKRGYDYSSFREDLRKCYSVAGINNTPIVFLLNDTQILQEEFLEDINNVLNSGDVPNLFEGDEYEKLILSTRVPCMEANYKDQSRDGIYEFFISRVRKNLHVVLCMSPIGDSFRKRCRMFPSLVNCCTIDWFEMWPQEALYSVAYGSLRTISDDEQQCENIASVCVMIHDSVEKASEKFFLETKRHYYTTPSSYLELLKQYHALIKQRTLSISSLRNKIANGLNKILETNDIVAIMEQELKVIVPIMEKKSLEIKDTYAKLEKDTAQVDAIKKIVMQDEAEAKIKAAETQELADDAAKDLETVMPQLRTAQDALRALNKNDVNEIRVFQKPPKLVQFVMEAVCVLLNTKPDWNNAKQIMADVNFLKKLQEYNANSISESMVKKLKPYIDHKDFQPAIVEKVSKTARSMCAWVIAMNRYAEVFKDIEPKIRKRDGAENELKQVIYILRQKQNQLAEVEGKVQLLIDERDRKQKEMHEIQTRYDLNNKRLTSAGRLTSALSEEEARWRETVERLDNNLFTIPGDILVAAAYVAYLGAFPIHYRKDMSKMWILECQRLQIPSGDDFDFISCLGDPYQVREWNICGLPRDDVSVENGIITTQSSRWTLCIDPQEQANRWIRNMEKENNLIITKMENPNLVRLLENAITSGQPVLIEEVQESLDPSLNPVLARSFYNQGGRIMMRFGENDIEYDSNFKLYMTTKLSNPHYLPEICIQVTLINFLVSMSGLEDQLLADIVRIELPEMEKQRNDLIVSINSDKQQLQMLEDKILKLLFSSEGNILDDDELVETLNESKEISIVIESRLIDTEKTEEAITLEREKYRPLAAKGAVLFFVVSSLSEIDPMYQVSLRYFTQIFCAVLEQDIPKMEFNDRIKFLFQQEIRSIFLNISRGLFEKHKAIYSFLLATEIEKHDNKITDNEFDFLLRGSAGSSKNLNDDNARNKPESLVKVSEKQWNSCIFLEEEFPHFANLTVELSKKIVVKFKDQKFNLTDGFEDSSTDWNETLSPFSKLILISVLKPEEFMLAVNCYIRDTLGREFVESKTTSIASVYRDMTPSTPLIFILSSGSDPMTALQKFANEQDFIERLQSISLGQGQGVAAEALLTKARTVGNWIYLQNCHLSISWMPSLESIVRDLVLGNFKVHPDFRLFLSSMPSRHFPVSILQNSIKLTNETPKGLKSNLMRSLMDLDEEMFEIHIHGNTWRKMIFGLCMFHGVIIERKKFGSLGFNILYEFNDSDRDCALNTLNLFIDRETRKEIPWQALEYINGEITYGGRITDEWDRRCARTILKLFSSESILDEDYVYSKSGVYYCPSLKKLDDFKQFVKELPFKEAPEIFGMHENADIVYETKEGSFFLKTILENQSKLVSASTSSNDTLVMDIIQKLKGSIAKSITTDNMKAELNDTDSKDRVLPLTTVLLQETGRFNKLLKTIHRSLKELEKGINGFVVMSENLEAIYDSFLMNQVPNLWTTHGYLSTKSLSSWTEDLILRIEHIQNWIEQGVPTSVWISGFFFPQSFLTAVLQTHSRRYNLAIDMLKFDFEVLDTTLMQKRIYEMRLDGDTGNVYGELYAPDDGIYVHGLFLEAGKWDSSRGGLTDPKIGELETIFPVLWLKPCQKLVIADRYEAPLYKTPVRAGVLSTTGHSTNFILSIFLKSLKPPNFWILRGTALVTLLTD